MKNMRMILLKLHKQSCQLQKFVNLFVGELVEKNYSLKTKYQNIYQILELDTEATIQDVLDMISKMHIVKIIQIPLHHLICMNLYVVGDFEDLNEKIGQEKFLKIEQQKQSLKIILNFLIINQQHYLSVFDRKSSKKN